MNRFPIEPDRARYTTPYNEIDKRWDEFDDEDAPNNDDDWTSQYNPLPGDDEEDVNSYLPPDFSPYDPVGFYNTFSPASLGGSAHRDAENPNLVPQYKRACTRESYVQKLNKTHTRVFVPIPGAEPQPEDEKPAPAPPPPPTIADVVCDHEPYFQQALTLIDAWFERHLQPAENTKGGTDYLLRKYPENWQDLHRAVLSLSRIHHARLRASQAKALYDIKLKQTQPTGHDETREREQVEIASKRRNDQAAQKKKLAGREISLAAYLETQPFDEDIFDYLCGIVQNPNDPDDKRIIIDEPGTINPDARKQARQLFEIVYNPQLANNPIVLPEFNEPDPETNLPDTTESGTAPDAPEPTTEPPNHNSPEMDETPAAHSPQGESITSTNPDSHQSEPTTPTNPEPPTIIITPSADSSPHESTNPAHRIPPHPP